MDGFQEGTDEAAYDRRRLAQRLSGEARARGVGRRGLLGLALAAGAGTALPAGLPGTASARTRGTSSSGNGKPGIVKPLPEDLFTVRGTNAETRFEALRGTGRHTPADRFFVRNHTSTPRLDPDTWRLRVWGSGLRGGGAEFTLDDLRRLPVTETTALIECAGNARSFYDTQQRQSVSGTAWRLGAVGSARWRGVRLGEVLRRAGLARNAVDVMPRGLDAPFVDDGRELGRVRRPLPLAKALDDVLLAYEMNGEPLPYDHGYPVRVVVPSWVGISSIKWLGDIEVAAEPLYSPWNTELYRLFGPAHPPGGSAPLTRQTVKSAFELPWDARLPAGRPRLLTGRSWSGRGGIRSVEVSTDGGAHWTPAALHDPPRAANWTRWSLPWRPTGDGPRSLLARATDTRGTVQPERAVFNEQGYLFGAVVRHPVRVG
ncbi:sulfite oxidase [Streptomyces sp. ODS28]|uniref:sulfite oxidase n=1 Tax=Streptomyces sp. ODS28 TaxID=3136688 RepID=UPI0031EAD3A1